MRKYIDFFYYIVFLADHEAMSLPGLTLNIPCNGIDDMFVMGLNRPNYTWIHPDGSQLSGD